jgi:hypothetical protein
MLHVIFVLLVLLYINVIEEYVVSSLGSEALQIKINTNVTATIGDTNVELWCSYIKDGGEYVYYIKMDARNKSSEEFLQIATFYPPELDCWCVPYEPFGAWMILILSAAYRMIQMESSTRNKPFLLIVI